MRTTRPARLAILATAVLVLGACGTPGSGGGEADPTSSGTSGKPVCDPVAGEQLVVLEDDGGLQNADNIIPAVNAGVAQQSPAVIELLDTVSAALDTDKLIDLNKAVDIDRRTSSEVAKEFVADEGLAASDASAGAGQSLVVGAANFSESATLAEIYGEVLRSAGYQVEVRTIGNRDTYLPALVDGTLSTVPEYAATLADFLNARVNGAVGPGGRQAVGRAGPERVRRDEGLRRRARRDHPDRARRGVRRPRPRRPARVPRAPVLPARSRGDVRPGDRRVQVVRLRPDRRRGAPG